MRELLPQRIWQDTAGASCCATPTSCRALCVCRVLPKSPWLIHPVNNMSGKHRACSAQQEPPFMFMTDTSKMELWSMWQLQGTTLTKLSRFPGKIHCFAMEDFHGCCLGNNFIHKKPFVIQKEATNVCSPLDLVSLGVKN